MAKAIIHGREHDVAVQIVLEKNYAVTVLDLKPAVRATVVPGGRKAAIHRVKIHADSPEAAVRAALATLKEQGLVDDYVLESHEQLPQPEEQAQGDEGAPS